MTGPRIYLNKMFTLCASVTVSVCKIIKNLFLKNKLVCTNLHLLKMIRNQNARNKRNNGVQFGNKTRDTHHGWSLLEQFNANWRDLRSSGSTAQLRLRVTAESVHVSRVDKHTAVLRSQRHVQHAMSCQCSDHRK